MGWAHRAGGKKNRSTDRGDWISHCDKCGELLATDKTSLVSAHKKWCAETYEEPPRRDGTDTLAVLAFVGMAIGAVLSMFAVI
jgi:hypothetical protein